MKMRFVIPGPENEYARGCVGFVSDMESYHPARRNWRGPRNYYKIKWMSPEKFLKVVDPHFRPGPERLASIKKIPEDACFAPLQITPHKRERGDDVLVMRNGRVEFVPRYVIGHEGRHRALLATRLGIEKVPVIVWKKWRPAKRSRPR
jgi:hypothetical protein